MEIQLIMRWHLVRLYSANQLQVKNKESYIEVSMHPLQANKQTVKRFFSSLIKEKNNDTFTDQFSWWDLSDENALSGTIREKTLIKHLFDLPNLAKTLGQRRIPIRRNSYLLKERVLEEDMVFLQLCTDAKKFKTQFDTFKKHKGIFNIDPVLTQSSSMLIDFTQEARRMSGQIYKAVATN